MKRVCIACGCLCWCCLLRVPRCGSESDKRVWLIESLAGRGRCVARRHYSGTLCRRRWQASRAARRGAAHAPPRPDSVCTRSGTTNRVLRRRRRAWLSTCSSTAARRLTPSGSTLQAVPSLNLSRLEPRGGQMAGTEPATPSSFRAAYDGAQAGIRAASHRASSQAREQHTTGALQSFRDVFRSTAESAEQKGVDAGRGAQNDTRAGDGHRAESSGGGGDFKSAPAPHTARWMPLRDSLWDSSSLSDRGAGPGLNVGNRVQQMGEGAGHGAGGGGGSGALKTYSGGGLGICRMRDTGDPSMFR